MVVYSRVGFSGEYSTTITGMINKFCSAADKYMLDESIRLYRVPWGSEAYEYFKDIRSRLNEGDYFEIVDKVFSKADYKNAVAYCIRFGSFINTYDDICIAYYFDLCCNEGSVYTNQNRKYMAPKSSFHKKEYGILSTWRFAVSERIMQEIISVGANLGDFMPVVTKKNEIVCYQIEPMNVLHGMAEVNGWRVESGCSKCNFPIYRTDEWKAITMTKEIVSQLKILNKTNELLGDASLPEYIVSKELFEYLKNRYPKMGFEPIFCQSHKQ